MAVYDSVPITLSQMILSHSGWRGIFAADGNEESKTGEIGAAHTLIATGAALAFIEYLHGLGEKTPLVLVGTDTRPTGPAIAETVIHALIASGCQVRYAGVTAAPEIMALARSTGNGISGFIYISASHNPIGHNGLKFGLTDGGVLPAEETAKLTARFRSLMDDEERPAHLEKIISNADSAALRKILAAAPEAKKEALAAYSAFSAEVAWGAQWGYPERNINHEPTPTITNEKEKIEAKVPGFRVVRGKIQTSQTASNNVSGIAEAFRRGIAERPLGICCDFNGSARCVSIDRDFFDSLGIQFEAINAEPGNIAHRIVPEGESLQPCRLFLEEIHRQGPAFVLGYVPDCDGDRGNLVIWDEFLQRARALEAQEVFALACVAELAHLAWTGGGKVPPKTAIAANDPTSLRIDRIAEAFGVSVFRAEVGEANVVALARKLRADGYTVRILGEGSAGGNITHPSAVRDPLHTVLALAKLLCVRTENGKPGLFELWCRFSNQEGLYRPDFNLADITASLPPFATTEAYAPEAALQVKDTGHGALKSRYQQIFLREWDKRKNELKARYGICGWEAAAYNGTEERKNIAGFGEAGSGGLKICFLNADGKAVASIWMRPSATENVFRIMADAGGNSDAEGRLFERDLIQWQRSMTMEAETVIGVIYGITG